MTLHYYSLIFQENRTIIWPRELESKGGKANSVPKVQQVEVELQEAKWPHNAINPLTRTSSEEENVAGTFWREKLEWG